MSSFMGLQAKQVTVRTKARESQSGDSVPTPVPVDLLKNARGMNRVSLFYRFTHDFISFSFFLFVDEFNRLVLTHVLDRYRCCA